MSNTDIIEQIWNEGIGSVHGADVTTTIAVSTASQLAKHGRSLQAEIERLRGDLGMSNEAIGLCRKWVEDALGVTCAFVDDNAHIIAVLAQRAVLAGLAEDFDPKTLRVMQEATEPNREGHEKALGFPLPQPPRQS